MDEPLFDSLAADLPMLPPVRFNEHVQWQRIVVLSKPVCGHCTMIIHSGEAIPVQRARWSRIGRDGSVLELCETHMIHQKARDAS